MHIFPQSTPLSHDTIQSFPSSQPHFYLNAIHHFPSHSFIIGDVDDHTGRTSMSGVHNAQPTPTQLAPHFPSSEHTDAPRQQNSPRGSTELLGRSTKDIGDESATETSPDAPVQLDLAQTSPTPPSDQQIGAPSISHTPQSFAQSQSPSATDEFLNPPYAPYVPIPEDVTWDEASAEIETFDWDKKGSG
jgi:hypothetical protein